MKRKGAWCGLSYLAGTLLYCTLGESFAAIALAAAAIAALCFLAADKYRVYAAAVGISVLCGLFCGRAYTLFRIEPALELDGKQITALGKVISCGSLGHDSYRLEIDGEADGRELCIIVYADRPFELYSVVRVTLTAEALEDTDSFPTASYYRPRGIYLRGNAQSAEETGEYASPIMRGVTALRDYTSRCIAAAMDRESASFAEALICGDKSEISPADKTKLYRAGAGHIFAMSGTHIAVIVLFFELLLRALIPHGRLRTAALIPVILLFMGFGGFSASIVRAGIMAALVCCTQLMHRRTDVLSSLGICAVIMCGIDPYISTSQSFICSFLACFAFGAAAPALTARLPHGRLRAVTVPLISSAAVTAVMLPYMALAFDEVSVIAPITNLLIVPLFTAALSLILLAMLFGGTILPARVIFRFAELLIKAALRLTDAFASFGFSAAGGRLRVLMLICSVLLIAALIIAVRRGRPQIFAFVTVGAFTALWAVQSLSALFDRTAVRVKIFTGSRGGVCAAVMNGGSCTVLDTGTKGSCLYGLQGYISYSGAARCGDVFVSTPLGAEVYLTEVYPEFSALHTDGGYYSEPFTEGMTADLGAFTVERTAEGYLLSGGKGSLVITAKGAFTQDGTRVTEAAL